MMLLPALILYAIAAILGLWSTSLLWRAWHSWRLQRRAKQGAARAERVVSPGRRRFGVGVALVALPLSGVALSFGEVVRGGGVDSDIDVLTIVFQACAAVMLFMALGALYVAWRFDPSVGRRRCGKCWYDMSATQGRLCSECGFEATSEKGMFRTRRAPRLALVSMMLVVGAYAVYVAPQVNRNGWQAAVPTTALIIGVPLWPDQYIDGTAYSLVRRAREGALWGWQKSLLRWRVNRLIQRSADIEVVGRAAVLASIVYEDGVPRARMNAAAQIAFLTALKADTTPGKRSLRPGILYSVTLLPDVFAPEAIPVALPAVTGALSSTNPMLLHWGVAMAPSLGREAAPLVPSLVALAENQSLWPQTRMAAYSSLSRIGEWDDAAWATYLNGFDTPDNSVRAEIVRCAESVRRKDESIRVKLVTTLGDPSDEIVGLAAGTLLKISPTACEVVPGLAPILRSRPGASVWFITELAEKCPCTEVVEGIRVLLVTAPGTYDYPALLAATRLGVDGEPLLPMLRRMNEESSSRQGAAARLLQAIEAIEAGVRERDSGRGSDAGKSNDKAR